MDVERPAPGRPRDKAIDAALLAAAVDELGAHGYEALSLARVAAAAGTTRQALYRRFPTKADLATAAVASLARRQERAPTDDPRADLERELAAFREGITRPGGISLIGGMLQDGADPHLVALFRERVVAPRRGALRDALERARAAGLVTGDDAALGLAVSMLTGSWYALALAGEAPPPDWPRAAAALVWRALGGSG